MNSLFYDCLHYILLLCLLNQFPPPETGLMKKRLQFI